MQPLTPALLVILLLATGSAKPVRCFLQSEDKSSVVVVLCYTTVAKQSKQFIGTCAAGTTQQSHTKPSAIATVCSYSEVAKKEPNGSKLQKHLHLVPGTWEMCRFPSTVRGPSTDNSPGFFHNERTRDWSKVRLGWGASDSRICH